MTEHELTEEKIEELWNACKHVVVYYDELAEHYKAVDRSFARAAYDLGKQAREDDGFIPCTFDDVRKGDTVERTFTYPDGAIVTAVGVAHRQGGFGDWRSRDGASLARAGTDYTYRRKPAEVAPPDPEKHPIILDENGDAWFWNGERYSHEGFSATAAPYTFGNDWTPAKVVAKKED